MLQLYYRFPLLCHSLMITMMMMMMIGPHIWFVDCCHVQWLWMTPTQILGAGHYLTLNIDKIWSGQCVGPLLFAMYMLLSMTLHCALTFSWHVTNVVRACTYHTHALRYIRPLLTIDTAKSITTSIVGARLDYCNSLLYGTSEGNLDRLQRVQNQLAHVVLQAPWTVSATDMQQ